MPTRPGRTVRPVMSMTVAPTSGGVSEPVTAAIFPSWITTVRSACSGPPVPSITRTWVRAMRPDGTFT